jgi:hypothetical protein
VRTRDDGRDRGKSRGLAEGDGAMFRLGGGRIDAALLAAVDVSVDISLPATILKIQTVH